MSKRARLEPSAPNASQAYLATGLPLDEGLTEEFVWHKKREKEGLKGKKGLKSKEELAIMRLERQRELEKVREAKARREVEREQWEEERLRLERERDMLEHVNWQKEENEFHLRQARLKSEIRLQEGRAKPIDYITRNLRYLKKSNAEESSTTTSTTTSTSTSSSSGSSGAVDLSTIEPLPALNPADEFNEISLVEPFRIFTNMTLEELQEARSEIDSRVQLDEETTKPFWQAMAVCCEDAIDRQTKIQQSQDPNDIPGMHASVVLVTIARFACMSTRQLNREEKEIQKKLHAPSDGTFDVTYLEPALKLLRIVRAKLYLRKKHRRILKNRLRLLESQWDGPAQEQEQNRELLLAAQRRAKDIAVHDTSADPDASVVTSGPDPQQAAMATELPDDDLLSGELPIQDALQASLAKSNPLMSLVPQKEAHPAEMHEDLIDDDTAAQEGQFGDVVPVERVYHWSDKYRPRKPRFFNKVRTGYEWNKYNQTHYDSDNPPPKVVLGYRFNIFYPDLIDKTKAPQYLVEKCPDSDDFRIIRFHAGPPYEDIAFKIVHKEWEFAPRRGFRCSFEHGVLHLFFNFRRYRYRR
eukprot:gnl/Trimastix_PCT/940.p1 GENE.gnl/Trimastix_PCT/940~~gnl/Trimastix_PCT/940.p1  ORF type:complete len:584 (+),score=129.67 gnl/Trimastix_PCT/940:34-1785(+)